MLLFLPSPLCIHQETKNSVRTDIVAVVILLVAIVPPARIVHAVWTVVRSLLATAVRHVDVKNVIAKNLVVTASLVGHVSAKRHVMQTVVSLLPSQR